MHADKGLTMKSELQKLNALVKDIKIAMMTTRRRDGHLESRAMATQKPAAGADLWFVTAENTAKLDDLASDPHVNLAFLKAGSWEWISVSGIATISRDRAKIHELYESDWKMWFAGDGDPRHGTADDPRMVLIGVDIHAAVFFEVDKPKPVVLYEMAKGWLTGSTPDVGDTHVVGDARRHAGD